MDSRLMSGRSLKHFLWVFAVFSLTACFSPVKPPAESKYIVKATPAHVPKGPRRSVTVMVGLPGTSPVYNTRRMAYSMRPYEVAYFGLNQWAETPSNMLQPLLVSTLQRSQRYAAIIMPPFSGRYSYLLSTQILDFRQNYIRQPAVFELSLRIQLVNMSSGRVTGTKEINISQPIHGDTPYAGVYAANRATERALKEVAAFCASKIY